MMQGMMFGGEGPIMQGTWYNPSTGDFFTVRDSFFEDNQYVVTTTDGRYLYYNQLQNYIQSDMKPSELKNLNSQNKQVEPLPTEVASLINTDDTNMNNNYMDMMTPEDMALINKPLGNINDQNSLYTSIKQVNPITSEPIDLPVNMNTAIIEKALKNTEKPEFKVELKWDNYPTKQLEMLYDIMSISEEEIVEWYLDNIKLDDVLESLKQSIKDRIITTPEPEKVLILECEVGPAEIPTKPNKSSKKLSKKTKKND